MTANLAPIKIPQLLRKYGLRPDKRLGQNFLVDDAALRRVIEAAEIGADEAVLEIGAGLGSLTRYIAITAQQVIAIEIDKKLMPALQEIMASFDNVRIINGNILNIAPGKLTSNFQPPTSNYIVVANIPYYITSAIIRHLLETTAKPQRIVLTVQKEVAERICAPPGQLSLLALSVQVYGEPKIVARIPSGAFYPAPKVDSAVVKIELFPESVIPSHHIPQFFQLTKAGFSQKRKTLLNSISAGMAWPKEITSNYLKLADIDPQRRAETLSLDEWGNLVKTVSTQNQE